MKKLRAVMAALVGVALIGGCGVDDGSGAQAPTAKAEGRPGQKDLTIGPILNLFNYALNPSFETPDSSVPVPLYSGFVAHGSASAGYFAGWASAAEDWPATSNDLNYGTVTTWLTNEHVGGQHSILVAAGTNNGGIGQVYWQSADAPPLQQKLTVRLRVVSGKVVAAIGRALPNNFAFNYGYSQANPNALNADGTTVGPQWETVTVCAPAGIGANQVFFYASGGPAVYYVDSVVVYPDTAACP